MKFFKKNSIVAQFKALNETISEWAYFKFGQAVPETFAIQFSEKGGFCGQELKGNFILGVAPKTEFLMAFFVVLW